jgi:hypothetical protein
MNMMRDIVYVIYNGYLLRRIYELVRLSRKWTDLRFRSPGDFGAVEKNTVVFLRALSPRVAGDE